MKYGKIGQNMKEEEHENLYGEKMMYEDEEADENWGIDLWLLNINYKVWKKFWARMIKREKKVWWDQILKKKHFFSRICWNFSNQILLVLFNERKKVNIGLYPLIKSFSYSL